MPRKRLALAVAACLLALLAIAGAAYAWVGGRTLAGLAAKSTCTCVFVSRRPEADCTGSELKAQGIGFVRVTVDHRAAAVEARALLRSARASLREGAGCTLE